MTYLNRAKTVSINEQYFRYNAFYVAVCSASVFPDNSVKVNSCFKVMGFSSNRLLGLPYGLSAGQMFSTLSGKAAMVLQ